MDSEYDIRMEKKKFHLVEADDTDIIQLFGVCGAEDERMYVTKAGDRMAGAIILSQKQPELYERIMWGIRVPEHEILCIRKIIVLPGFVGAGITMSLLLFAERLALRRRIKTIRFDASVKEPFDPLVFERKGYLLRENNGGINVYEKVIFPWDLKKY